ncbi:hypothetical protein N0V83_003519 [Neocucurbitaria cava]|uniref:J domain-containing protein n=1 Tax=Neocucurbitaria cava TaxID=798079 RepID=A0A9W8YCE7_9PLEO|nr:hypothetical protein N0V83_003519 [Neocucurbitaria cava]
MNNAPTPPDVLNFYAILGLNQCAPRDRIETAYTSAKRKYHPQSQLIGAEPNEEKFKEAGLAYDTLSNPRLRAKYDLNYHNVRALWNAHNVKLQNWIRQKQQDEERRARLEAQRHKRAANEVRKKEAEAGSRRAAQAEAEIRKKREEEARLRRKVEQEQADAQRARARHEKRLRETMTSNGNAFRDGANQSLRERWQAAQERTRQRAKAAEEANNQAARERLRKQQEDDENQQNERTNPPAEDPGDETEDTERARQKGFAERQRAADQREQRVFEEDRQRRAAAAEERLHGHERSLKRPASLGREEEEEEEEEEAEREAGSISIQTEIVTSATRKADPECMGYGNVQTAELSYANHA